MSAMKKIAALGALLGVLLPVSACSSAATGDADPKVEKAYKKCLGATNKDPVPEGTVLRLGDDGHTLIVDGLKKSTDMANLGCILTELKASSALANQIDSTTAMMGRQSGESNGLNYEWSYHPENGMDMTVSDAD